MAAAFFLVLAGLLWVAADGWGGPAAAAGDSGGGIVIWERGQPLP